MVSSAIFAKTVGRSSEKASPRPTRLGRFVALSRAWPHSSLRCHCAAASTTTTKYSHRRRDTNIVFAGIDIPSLRLGGPYESLAAPPAKTGHYGYNTISRRALASYGDEKHGAQCRDTICHVCHQEIHCQSLSHQPPDTDQVLDHILETLDSRPHAAAHAVRLLGRLESQSQHVGVSGADRE